MEIRDRRRIKRFLVRRHCARMSLSLECERCSEMIVLLQAGEDELDLIERRGPYAPSWSCIWLD